MKQVHVFLGIIMLLTMMSAEAQVKIGSNPGTIGSTSNLEVEASNGNKTSVNRTSGQVTIQDGTQGSGKVLTSDASGNTSWQSGTSAFRVVQTSTQAFPASTTTYYNIDFSTKQFDQDNAFNTSTNRFTVPVGGTYIITGGMTFSLNSNTAASIAIFKNGTMLQTSGASYPASTVNALIISTIDVGNVGDYFEIRANVNVGQMNVLSSVGAGTRIK